jgi:hypothetical protein
MILSINLPLNIARQLWEAAGKDNYRPIIQNTFNVVKNDTGFYCVSTDTHRLFKACIENFGTLDEFSVGTYRWLVRPNSKLQIVETLPDVEGSKYPNWTKLVGDIVEQKREIVGRFRLDSVKHLTFKGEMSFNPNLLPITGDWEVYGVPKEPLKPLHLKWDKHEYLMMPMHVTDDKR